MNNIIDKTELFKTMQEDNKALETFKQLEKAQRAYLRKRKQQNVAPAFNMEEDK